jgi:Flp pilus assembly CpaF family ATPase
MGGPSKPMAKNSNSKFTPRNNKQDIFSKISKSAKQRVESNKPASEAKETDRENAVLYDDEL